MGSPSLCEIRSRHPLRSRTSTSSSQTTFLGSRFRRLGACLRLPCTRLKHNNLYRAFSSHRDLTPTARQGVLWLNTSLTVRGGQAASHANKGWEVRQRVRYQKKTYIVLMPCWLRSDIHRSGSQSRNPSEERQRCRLPCLGWTCFKGLQRSWY